MSSFCRSWFLTLGISILIAQAAYARPAFYVPEKQWTKDAWQCGRASKSEIEIESIRLPTSTVTNLKVTGLTINGNKVPSNAVKDLDPFIGSVDTIQSVLGGCGGTGEFIVIFGFVRGRSDPKAIERREFFVPYAR